MINLAASLAYTLLEQAYKTRLPDPQRKALEQVYARGFEQMLRSSRTPLSPDQLKEIGDVLTSFVTQTGTADAYLALALHNEEPNLDELGRRFRNFDGPAKLHGTRFDFERSMLFFYQGLTDALVKEAGKADSPLVNLVTVNQNRSMLQALNQLRELPQSAAGQNTAPSSVVGAPVADQSTTQYHSCFISYSSKDQTFVERLYSALRREGVPCWYAPEDLPIGGRIRQVIDDAIHEYDKLLIVLSRYSVNSSWVEKEVETAFDTEAKRKQQGRSHWLMLFPIRLDDMVMKTEDAWAADIRRMRNIGDFSQWKSDDIYQARLQRLLRDLRKA